MTRRAALFPVLAVCWVLIAAWRGGGFAPPTPRGQSHRVLRLDPKQVEVLDGDTLRCGAHQVRLLGVDTPEKAAPWFDGDQEPWASRASALVRRAVDEARRVELHTDDRRDRFGRLLGHVVVDGDSISAQLVEAGLGYPTVDRYGDGGFPAYADQITRRARPPAFPPPWRWRSTHRLE